MQTTPCNNHQKRHKNNPEILYMLIMGSIIIVNIFKLLKYNKPSDNKEDKDFEEIIRLAKENSPEFWGYFQEKYPDFRKNMLYINPDLKVSELVLCAYIYLGFNTKDIAEYTFKAVQTVKNNKYNLRKRLSVPAKHNFILWMRKIYDR